MCSNCQPTKIVFTDLASWAEFEGPLREGLHSLKYHQNIGLGDFFSPFLISIVENRQWNPDLVVPVPISKSRRKTRGYNQSELLSRPLARYFHLPHEHEAFIRVKDTESQIQLSAEDRFRNMDDAFFGNPAKLKGKSILVIDDIITTGATMNQCAKALFKAGADKVYGLSVAKTLRNQA